MADLFTAFDMATLSASIKAIFTIGVGILMLVTGYKYLKKGSRQM